MNMEELEQRIVYLKERAQRLRRTLIAIIGVDSEAELIAMRDFINLNSTDPNKTIILDAINVLLDTMPDEDQL